MLSVKNKQQKERILLFGILAFSLMLLSTILIFQYFKKKAQNKVLFSQVQKFLQTEEQWKIRLDNNNQDNNGVLKGNEITDTNIEVSKEIKNQILEGIDGQIKKSFYLTEETTLVELAKKINTNTKYLSIVINSHFKMPYSNFLNELRIKHALRMYNEDDSIYLKYSIKGISEELGYKSSRTYVSAFKKFTGMDIKTYLNTLETE